MRETPKQKMERLERQLRERDEVIKQLKRESRLNFKEGKTYISDQHKERISLLEEEIRNLKVDYGIKTNKYISEIKELNIKIEELTSENEKQSRSLEDIKRLPVGNNYKDFGMDYLIDSQRDNDETLYWYYTGCYQTQFGVWYFNPDTLFININPKYGTTLYWDWKNAIKTKIESHEDKKLFYEELLEKSKPYVQKWKKWEDLDLLMKWEKELMDKTYLEIFFFPEQYGLPPNPIYLS